MEQIFFQTPIGIVQISGTKNKGISSIKKVENIGISDENCQYLEDAKIQLLEYFDGKRKSFDLQLDYGDASAFQKSVWNILLSIPYGKTTSYSEIANKINNPKSVRAVGLANRQNRFAIVVPCHRVIGKGGDLTGYFYGLETKKQLLRLENPEKYAIQSNLSFE